MVVFVLAVGSLQLLVLLVMCLLTNELCCLCGLDRWDRKYGSPWGRGRMAVYSVGMLVAAVVAVWHPAISYIGMPLALLTDRLIRVWQLERHRFRKRLRDHDPPPTDATDLAWLADEQFVESDPQAARKPLRWSPGAKPMGVPTRGGNPFFR